MRLLVIMKYIRLARIFFYFMDHLIFPFHIKLRLMETKDKWDSVIFHL
jgi:hypothetical protein